MRKLKSSTNKESAIILEERRTHINLIIPILTNEYVKVPIHPAQSNLKKLKEGFLYKEIQTRIGRIFFSLERKRQTWRLEITYGISILADVSFSKGNSHLWKLPQYHLETKEIATHIISDLEMEEIIEKLKIFYIQREMEKS